MRQITTLAIIEDGDNALLAMKKRGFGEGWWNGYGGKVEPDEAVDDAMVRELYEEAKVRAKKFGKRAVLEFYFAGTDKIVEMHVYEVTEFTGEPIETEEMAPKWFTKQDIPYDDMWPADRNWMPLYFAGSNIIGKAVFDGVSKQFIESDFKIVDTLD